MGDCLPNSVFEAVTTELEVYVGDILAIGMTKKALKKFGYSAEDVTPGQMSQALRAHIAPSLLSFMSPDKSRAVVRELEHRIEGART